MPRLPEPPDAPSKKPRSQIGVFRKRSQPVKSGPMKRFIRARLDGRQLSNSTIWSTIYPLARHFKVSPTLMRRCLVDLGWLKRTPRANSKSHLSLVLRTPAEQ